MKRVLCFLVVLTILTPFYSNGQENPHPTINSILKGQVSDSVSKLPLANVSVQIKGITNGTTSDARGAFTLYTAQKFPFTIVVTSVGYEAKEIVATGSPIDVFLKPATSQLEDVVVVGYGTQRKKDLVGAISKISAAEVNKIPVASFDAQLQGKAAGLQVVTNSGVPGEGIFVRLRGTTSINSSSDPLYIIDGVFVNNTSLQTTNLGGRTSSPLADINPADIESIELLKDASATAIYGSRGANGVVIVTTKQGAYKSKVKIDLNVSNGWVEADKSVLPNLLSGPNAATLVNEYWVNSGHPEQSPFRPVSEGGLGAPEDQKTYDRLGFLLRKGYIQDYNIGIQGGTDKTRYYLGAGYTNQDAFFKVIGFNRASLKFNFDNQLTSKIKIGLTNSLSRSYRNQARLGDGPQGRLWGSAITGATYSPTHDASGALIGLENTYSLVDNYDVNTTSLRYIGGVFAEATLADGLKFKSSVSADYNLYDEYQYWNTNTSIGSAVGGKAISAITQNTAWINEQVLSYNKRISDHNFSALIGNTLQSNELKYTYAEGNGFANNNYKLISSAASTLSSDDWTKNTIVSYFGRLAYSFADKYFGEFSIRADGSSKFGANNRWGTFPAFGLGWRIKNEAFLRDVKWVNDLKFRASYGITGNQSGINDFAARGLWSGGSPYADVAGTPLAGIGPLQLGNDDLKWEKTAQTDVGLDAALFDNRLSITFDYYYKYTSDLLLQKPVPATSGFSEYWANVGEVSNRGYELNINSVNIRKNHFTWNTSLNISGNKNRIEKLPTQITKYTRDWVILKEGYSLNSFWLYEQLYVDPNTGNPVFAGQDANGTVTADDRKILHNFYPKFYGGITNSITFRQFDFSTLFSFQYGNYNLNLQRFFLERNPGTGADATLLKRWQKPGDITDVPKLTSAGYNYTLDQNSRYLEDASFIRLKQLSIGYTLPKEIVQRLKLSNLRFYFIGANLFILTKYTGDPETNVTSDPNAQGLGGFGTPPQPRSFQFGFNLTF
ncbi:SusC/RagA family TonB-linked outer membrane protein [Niabella ginsenosidivorans]|uniref:SusC/RagA family TonB-linked outer membrane protein n=1 Tax=Niabella ginsenosidivorans TaxID=1176587 RepID=A0A1A9I1C8_9BACT|nr:TonB-dependent receptor [Niabella ginsenosidivorans]ANH81426.1 SusC/RagA family TonB-linked outer membrane protein [Niabella ginsenosidivorans]